MVQIEQSGIRREKTAIVRFSPSRPVALALSHGIIAAGVSVLDYGCGRGEDLKHLARIGITAAGWDPHYRPETPLNSADVVNLGYVLNVIENAGEREATLKAAYELAKRVLIVAVRVDRALESATEFADGLLTRSGSFQKLYRQNEFRDYLHQVLGVRPHMAGLGIAYVFRDPQLEWSYLTSLSQAGLQASRTHGLEQFGEDPLAKKYLALATMFGRAPLPSEFENYPELQDRFGSTQRIERLALQLLSAGSVQNVRERRKVDILTFIAMTRLQGMKPLPFRLLPSELRADIKMLWRSYSSSLEEGEKFLFELGNPETVRAACQSAPVGKKLPDALYAHRSVEEQLGPLLRLLIFAGRQVVGEVDYNLIKVATDGRSIAFLQYERFDEDAHPALHHSVRVYLPRAEYSIRDYSQSTNPPILHRKEMLVDPLYQGYGMFAELSRQEEQLGLLSRPDIGTRQAWIDVLSEKHLTIKGHRLFELNSDGSSFRLNKGEV